MRPTPLKLRAYDKVERRWLSESEAWKHFAAFNQGDAALKNIVEVQEGAGVRDCNGVEIFEGDFCRSRFVGGYGKVVWNGNVLELDDSCVFEPEHTEVVGNVFDGIKARG